MTKLITKNFNRAEFACKCGCGFDQVDPVLVNRLQRFRDLLCFVTGVDVPVTVTSGCRCLGHNKAVGGAPGSLHCQGWAADIAVNPDVSPIFQRSEIEIVLAAKAQRAMNCRLLNIGGIGAYPGDGIIHLDIRPGRINWIVLDGDYLYGVDFIRESEMIGKKY